MKTLTVISISLVALAMISCSSPSGRRAKAAEMEIDSVRFSYSIDSVKCEMISIVGYDGDSVKYFNNQAFVKNSRKSKEWIKRESEGIMRYSRSIDSVVVDRYDINVVR